MTEGEDWFYDAVAYVYENGIMAGTSETTFEPYMELNRAQAAQLFYNLEGKPAVTGDSTFSDVTPVIGLWTPSPGPLRTTSWRALAAACTTPTVT